jgi:hypothetical protein
MTNKIKKKTGYPKGRPLSIEHKKAISKGMKKRYEKFRSQKRELETLRSVLAQKKFNESEK